MIGFPLKVIIKYLGEPTMNQEKDTDIIKKLEELSKEAKDYRKQFEKSWNECERFYDGKHWKRAKERNPKNFIFSIVEAEIPILTDTRPSSAIIPLEEQHEDVAKVLESAVVAVYDNQDLMIKLTQAVRSAMKTGTGWLYVDWDPDLHRGQGEVTLENMGWRRVWIEAGCSDISKACYARIETPMKVDDIKRRYPKAKDIKDIKAEKVTTQMGGDSPIDGLDATRDHHYDDGESTGVDLQNTAIVVEEWVKDYSMVKITEEETLKEIAFEAEEFMKGENPDIGKYEDHASHIEAHNEFKVIYIATALGIQPEHLTEQDIENAKQDPELGMVMKIIDDHISTHEVMHEQNPNGEKPKYKNSLRLVIRTNVDKILFDGEAQVDDGMIPLVPIYCYKSEESVYGIGEIKNIIGPQKSFNEIDQAEYEGLRLTTNGLWIVGEGAGVVTSLTNAPGGIIKVKDISKIRRESPGQISPQLGIRKDGDRQAIDGISGMNEASQGRRPTGITAANAIEFLQQQSNGRVRLKTRLLEEFSVPRLSKLVAARVVKYYPVARKLRIYDANGRLKFIEYDPEKFQDLDYDVKHVPGSTAGLSKESIFTVMKELLMGGMIDQKTFFKLTDIPYKATIMEELEKNDQNKAMLEQLAMENEQLKAALGQPQEQVPENVTPIQQMS